MGQVINPSEIHIRAPRHDSDPEHYEALIIGAGFAGLYAVWRLRQEGLRVLAFERGSDVGGVWYWNRYPGARCDCESYYYSYSFSEELHQEWDWTLHYAHQPEILSYLNHVADRFTLRDHICFNSEVAQAHYDEEKRRWRITTEDGRAVTSDFLISAAGCLSAIRWPDIPGIRSFSGRLLHTAAWPKEAVDFSDRTVGVIGTGASAVQAIPLIARQAKHLTVFQRTANWVIPVWNKPMSKEFKAWVKANYGTIRHRCLTTAGAVPFEVSEVSARVVGEAERRIILDRAWETGGTRFFAQSFNDLLTDEVSNEMVAEFVRSYIRRVVRDPSVAEALIPTDHPIGTKRPPMDDDYYDAFNRPDVSLVDLRREPIIAVSGQAVTTSRNSFVFDDLVVATGFDAITGALLAIDVRGCGGLTLQEAWSDGPVSYLGLAVSGFPNLFTVTGPLSPSVLANMPTAIEQHVDWIADCIVHLKSRGMATIEALPEAQANWTAHTAEVAEGTLYPRANSWYLGANIPGKPRRFGVYLGGFGSYRERCAAVAQAGYEGFAIEDRRQPSNGNSAWKA